jgi:chemotaxis protein MotA
MKFYIGIGIVFASVLLGYALNEGHLRVLFQPFEFLIILGSAIGAYVAANPISIVKRTPINLKKIVAGSPYAKKDYSELLFLLYTIFKAAKTQGMLTLERHIENPHESDIFQKFPNFLNNHKALHFICDYIRLLTMGIDNVYQIDDLVSSEIETFSEEGMMEVNAFEKLADGLPALGIVAAVLGVIHTMGSISQPPEVLGQLIGGALVGTFTGILISYGVVAPMSQSLKGVIETEIKYLTCIKTAIVAYLNGHPPIVIVEHVRKIIEEEMRPTFSEMEEAMSPKEAGSGG